MKIPEPKKTAAGRWRIQLRIGGRSIPVVEDTRAKCEAKAMAIKAGVLDERTRTGAVTLTKAIDRYIEDKAASLSPSTVKGYRNIQKNRFQDLMEKRLDKLTEAAVQKAINREAEEVSAKTVKNSWMFLASVISHTTKVHFDVSLPVVVPNEHPYLMPEQIPVFLDAIQGHRLEIGMLLGLLSLRRSEILGLTWDKVDFKTRSVKIAGSMVPGENGMIHKETNKNAASRRVVPMTSRLFSLLTVEKRKSGYVCPYSANALCDAVNRVCAENSLPKIGAHGLRHSFASLAYYLNIPEKTAMKIGGWSDDKTMRKIYTHISQKQIADESEKILRFLDQAEGFHKQSVSNL